ncbi:MAG: hypothetical protein L0Z50_12665 [Verrucomicrobiales bacterium]|nr:hypothetical protein [Verrucomicrobiales bacterium]
MNTSTWKKKISLRTFDRGNISRNDAAALGLVLLFFLKALLLASLAIFFCTGCAQTGRIIATGAGAAGGAFIGKELSGGSPGATAAGADADIDLPYTVFGARERSQRLRRFGGARLMIQ